MSAWLKKNKNLWAPTIFVLVFGFVAVAYAVIEFALTGRVVPGALLIAGLIVPSLLLPVFAFGSSAQSVRRSQDLVREKNTQLNLVMDNMAQGLCMFDGDQRLILSNRLYAEMYGLSAEIVRPGTTFREILQYRIENGMFAGADAEAYLDERMAAIAENDRSTKIQKLTDGRTIAICHTPMPGGGWLATHEYISEQTRSEVALMESEARLRAILDNAPFCLNLKDMDGRYIFANKGYEEWWGRPKSEAIGKLATEFHGDPARVERLSDLEAAVVETGETQQREMSVDRDGAGELYYRLLIKFPVKSPNGDIMALGTFAVDITERKRAEDELIRHRDRLQELVESATQDLKVQAEELQTALAREKEMNELQRQFISMASHEFRTPLAIIDSSAQRLKKARESMTADDVLKRTDKIRKAVNRMTQLMESTLTAARMEEGKVKFEIGDANIASLLWDVCERQAEVSESHAISCDASGLPDSIRADSSALEQIFTNLLSNAVKYAPNNPEIDVSTWQDGENVFVSVHDNGVGMEPDDIARLGERFFRAKSSMGIAGTGIGLNLVKILVELHDGSIDVQSEIGSGSTFTVRLPIAGPSQQAEDSAESISDAA